MNDTKPNINVTPLIDVLLVLLVIFMVITPLKPSDFKTKIPQEPTQKGDPNPLTLIVSINSDKTLRLNTDNNLGTVSQPQKLIEHLSTKIRERTENGVFDESGKEIVKTVFIKAPRILPYGEVVKVVDAVKIAGAEPISLQIDDLE
ncbi:MAG TPA: biopolymer transporter ExbD [Pyrinomonadaceae bacterium]|nr:biopolymer transporter ExbD [Pyrinomonadaceae bacterium]